ncbi:MAG: TIM-barrel domain-containing protein [Acutalibacteraceae bacterium]
MKAKHNFLFAGENENGRVYTDGKTEILLDFISENTLRVAIFKTDDILLPTFNVNPKNDFDRHGRDRLSLEGFTMYEPTSEKTSFGERIFLGQDIAVEVSEGEFSIKYYKGEKLLFSDRDPYPYNFDGEFGKEQYHYVSRLEGEKIFGLGDKGGKLNKAGRAFRIETADSMGYNAETTDILYKHVPFYICENEVGSYGIFYDTAETSYMDLGNEINNYYEPYKYFKTQDNALIYYVFFGTKLEILKSFSTLCGRQAFPPKWSFDYCASTMAYTDAQDSQAQMDGFLNKLSELDISCKAFYLSSGYTSIGAGRYVFNWNYDKFPKPESFIERFKNEGIEILPNIKPAFLLSHPMYEKIASEGLFIKNPDGTPFVTRFWDGNGSYLDFTNKKAYDFWKRQVKEKLLDFGINYTWNDNNEFDIKDCDAVCDGFGEGEVKASRIRSQFTELMVMSSYEAQREKNPDLRQFISSRSGGAGMRRFAQTWSGDNRTAFEDLRYCHNIGLTLSLSSLSFYGHDLGGFSGDMPSKELLLRWLQHGMFEPRLTVHSWNKDGSATMPWSYPEAIESVRALFAQRKKLLPYLYNTAYKSVQYDEPVNSPLWLYYDDEKIATESDTMLFGRDILVPFIFDEGKTETEVYLPKGNGWYLGGKLYKGGESVRLQILPTDKMPYFVKEGTVLPVDEADYGFKAKEKLAFIVYPKKKGTFESDFFTDDGVSFKYLDGDCVKLNFKVECDEKEIKVAFENLGKIKLSPEIKLVDGEKRKLLVLEK